MIWFDDALAGRSTTRSNGVDNPDLPLFDQRPVKQRQHCLAMSLLCALRKPFDSVTQ
jgi:hypothetical protein